MVFALTQKCMFMDSSNVAPDAGIDTRTMHAGRDTKLSNGLVNIPPYRGSTILFDKVDDLESATSHRAYGRWGTPTARALERALAELAGGANAMLTPSGLSAITIALLASTKPGDHILVSDSVYPPTRKFCDAVLASIGISTSYYPPTIGAGIKELLQPNTTAVYTESPGSGTFEVQDIPAICAVAHDAGARVLMDNTWATPLLFKALEHGVDLSIHSLTKYVVGHSDAVLGAIVAKDRDIYRQVRGFHGVMGMTVSPDDAFLGLRGLRTMPTRLRQHQVGAMAVARWFKQHPLVRQVLYPPLPEAPGHDLWRRDFTGGSGLLGVILKQGIADSSVKAMLDDMRWFRLGYSWGGFESLILHFRNRSERIASPLNDDEVCLRIHVGLESPDDLIADLDAGLGRLQQHQNALSGNA